MVKSKSIITFEETQSNNKGMFIVEGRGVISLSLSTKHYL